MANHSAPAARILGAQVKSVKERTIALDLEDRAENPEARRPADATGLGLCVALSGGWEGRGRTGQGGWHGTAGTAGRHDGWALLVLPAKLHPRSAACTAHPPNPQWASCRGNFMHGCAPRAPTATCCASRAPTPSCMPASTRRPRSGRTVCAACATSRTWASW